MITTREDRADYFFRQEQHTRQQINERTEELRIQATRQIMQRVKYYPKGMQAQADLYIQGLHRSMCESDIERNRLIGLQQHYLRLAHAYRGPQ